MRSLAVVTVGRSDYGLYLPLLLAIQQHDGLNVRLLVSGTHLSPEFGLTVHQIEADGFPVADRIEMLLSSDSPPGIARSIGLGVIGFAQSFAAHRPDVLVVLGDRFEMYAACVAALPFNVPVAHIHGGEATFGAMDESLRHSMTKLSHIHFVATDAYRQRVEQLGEEPWRITVCGALSLDSLATVTLLDRGTLEAKLELQLDPAPLLVTFHPATLEFEKAGNHVVELLAALEGVGRPIVFTGVNADTGGRVARELIAKFVANHRSTRFIENLGLQAYFSAMSVAAAMVGNSSSGIIEAPSFELPVVNIGSRQMGRLKAANVIDVGYRREEIAAGMAQALNPGFRARLKNLKNPYYSGGAAARIVERLANETLDSRLLMKRFHDIKTVAV